MKRETSDMESAEHAAELEALAVLPEDRIDTCEVPEQKDWTGARRGVFFRPVKKQLTLRLDADLSLRGSRLMPRVARAIRPGSTARSVTMSSGKSSGNGPSRR